MEYKSLGTIVMSFCIFLIAIGVFLYVWKGENYYLTLIPGGLLLATVIVLKEPIDELWFKSKPPKMDDKFMHALEIEFKPIQSLNAKQKEEFSKRLALFLIRKDPYLVTEETEKLDLFHSALMAAPAIIIGFHRPFKPYSHIIKLVAYKHPFPSPRMQFLHAAELDMEDGVVIFSLEQMMISIRKPEKYYPIVYHIWASHFIQFNTDIDFPEMPANFIENIESVFPYGVENLNNMLGYDSYRSLEVAIVAYYVFPEKLKAKYPEQYQAFDSIFYPSEELLVN